jgi:hypothetical protein
MSAQLPDFTWEGHWWTTAAVLPSWSDAPIAIVFAPEGRGGEPLDKQEIALVQWAVDHEAPVSEALLSSLLAEYPSLQDSYGYGDEERAYYMPDVATVAELRSLIDLQAVYVHQVSKAGRPYIGFEFACRWDDEHGLGVLMHGDRTVEIGGVDTAILLWIAEGDAQKP